jgi:hypothetical protein
MQVIFDDALSPGQLRNLEKAFSGENGRPGVKVREAAMYDLTCMAQAIATSLVGTVVHLLHKVN